MPGATLASLCNSVPPPGLLTLWAPQPNLLAGRCFCKLRVRRAQPEASSFPPPCSIEKLLLFLNSVVCLAAVPRPVGYPAGVARS